MGMEILKLLGKMEARDACPGELKILLSSTEIGKSTQECLQKEMMSLSWIAVGYLDPVAEQASAGVQGFSTWRL